MLSQPRLSTPVRRRMLNGSPDSAGTSQSHYGFSLMPSEGTDQSWAGFFPLPPSEGVDQSVLGWLIQPSEGVDPN